MKKANPDMTRPPSLLNELGGGPVRRAHPIYSNSLPPCNFACPAGENIQAWLALSQAGAYEEAWQKLIENNPLPSVHGRVCYHPCENACNRGAVDSSVSIHAVERFLGDSALENGWKPAVNGWEKTLSVKQSGKRVLIIGAGPAGLSCAWHLRRFGHEVEMYEAKPKPGGMLRYGIPAYRMPRDVLDNELQRIWNAGVKLHLNQRVDDVMKLKADGNFDAVFLGIGAHVGKNADIPAESNDQIIDAVNYLAAVESGNPPKLGERVAIYGGGNTAMDASRTALRLGAKSAMIIYRRDRDHMPAHSEEVDEALEEGVTIHFLRTIKQIKGTTLTLEEMALDSEGKAQPTGNTQQIEADSIIMALGQDVDDSMTSKIPGLTLERGGVVNVNDQMMTSVDGIFAGGDMIPSHRTVTISTGMGKKAARCIDAWFRSEKYDHDKKPVMYYNGLHLWYETFAPAKKQSALPLENRKGFEEILGGYSQAEARYEAQRCYSCGNCFECDGCYGACPERAIEKLGKGKGYSVDYEKCTGCGACFYQCPCHAIEMISEEDQR